MTLEARLQEIARSRLLLVASDYDGTVAPIVSADCRRVAVSFTLSGRSIVLFPSARKAIATAS